MIGDNENNFPHKLLLTNRQVLNLQKAFANNLSADIKLSKTQWYNQEDFSVDYLVHYLIQTRLPLISNIIKPLAKSVLIPIGLTAAASAADAGIHKRYWDQGIQQQ